MKNPTYTLVQYRTDFFQPVISLWSIPQNTGIASISSRLKIPPSTMFFKIVNVLIKKMINQPRPREIRMCLSVLKTMTNVRIMTAKWENAKGIE
jgi:hypothetical protein